MKFLMEDGQATNIRFSPGPAAANLYCTINNITYRLCFDWSFDSMYWKSGSEYDIVINLLDFSGLEQINSDQMSIFIEMCEQMISKTQYYDYIRVNENRVRILLMLAKVKG